MKFGKLYLLLFLITQSFFMDAVGPQPPSNITACKTSCVFLSQNSAINLITWSAPTSGTTPAYYYIYRDVALTNLAAVIPADQTLQFADLNANWSTVYTYYLVTEDTSNNFSAPASITVTQSCQCS